MSMYSAQANSIFPTNEQNKMALKLTLTLYLNKFLTKVSKVADPFGRWAAINDTHDLIEKVHLDDLNVYLDTLDTQVFLRSSALKLAKKSNSTSFNLKQEVFIRRDEERPEEGWYL